MLVKNLDNDFVRPNLVRTPSFPPCSRREEGITQEKDSNNHTMTKLNQEIVHQSLHQTTPTQSPTCIGRREGIEEKGSHGQAMRPNLLRTPSLPLPLSIVREEIVREKESDPRMSKSTGQASPHLQRHKSMTQSSSIPRYRPPRIQEMETINSNCTKEMRRRYLNQTKLKRSPSDLESEEVQGFKDLGFTFDKDLCPSVVNILPGLQQKKPEDWDQDEARRPYLSEAWLVQSCDPPIPNWVPKASKEDMKAQIKFWARAVASNMRQEC
uniref:Uncharacterized protein n=1 Tax=Fagus sylvatica TaxID=28930 RepID=A0A2N9GPP3_FAGSY